MSKNKNISWIEILIKVLIAILNTLSSALENTARFTQKVIGVRS